MTERPKSRIPVAALRHQTPDDLYRVNRQAYIGDKIQLIRLGSVVGLGIASRDGAAMATVFPGEAGRIAAELVRLADG